MDGASSVDLARYLAVRDIASLQRAAIEGDDTERFERLAEQRERLMAELHIPRDPRAHRLARQALLATAAIDEACAAYLRKLLGQARSELHSLNQGKRAVRAYATPASSMGPGAEA